MTAKAQMTNTAPEARSFTSPINGSCSMLMRSANFSIAVLKISAVQAKPTSIRVISHSVFVTLNRLLMLMTITAAAKWKIMLGSCRNASQIPFSE